MSEQMRRKYDEDEVTGEYEIPDLTEHARYDRGERLHGAVIWVAIAISIVGLVAVIAVSR